MNCCHNEKLVVFDGLFVKVVFLARGGLVKGRKSSRVEGVVKPRLALRHYNTNICSKVPIHRFLYGTT